ncbi:MAG: molybdopterin-dependent oxidoreductase [Chloroflexota bacterium]
MKEITLTINDKLVRGLEGATLLEVCQANGVDVPTLCHLEGLSDVGACRMCVVEVEKERRPVPSCTYPAREGLVVKTHTEKLEKYRRMILELVLSERNHFCMFCGQSGDCELQKLAYRYQVDSVRFPYGFPPFPVDSTSEYLMVDHNRCVLCGRCVRTCAEIAGFHVLDFSGRGWKTVVSADLGQMLGESSCVACGACAQACPTGAILSKLSLYKGRASECHRVATVCPMCGVGCELNVLVKDGNLVRIEASKLSVSAGPLCKEACFELLRPARARVTIPMARNRQGKLEELFVDGAIEVAAQHLGKLGGQAAGMVSTRYPNEALNLFQTFMRKVVGSECIDTLDGDDYRLIAQGIAQFPGGGKGLDIECPVEEISEADCILVVGADPLRTHPTVAARIRRAMVGRRAKLMVVDAQRDVFPLWTDLWLKPQAGTELILLDGLANILAARGLVRRGRVGGGEVRPLRQYDVSEVSLVTKIESQRLEMAADMFGQAKRGVILYGKGLLEKGDLNLVTCLLNLSDLTGNWVEEHLRVISLKANVNSRGGWEMGLATRAIPRGDVKGLYLLLADEERDGGLLEWAKGLDFLMVQASYHSPYTAAADVVLPSPIWAEREGTYKSMDGRLLKSRRVLQPQGGLLQDQEIMVKLARKLGHNIGSS